MRLYKKQKLCSSVAIDLLFASGADSRRALAYPLRAIWRENPGRRCDAPLQMLISVPKKRLRHAVDRVKMRRRVREAFRLNQSAYPLPEGARVDMAFIYVANGLESYAAVEQAVCRLLDKMAASEASAPDVQGDLLAPSSDIHINTAADGLKNAPQSLSDGVSAPQCNNPAPEGTSEP